MSWEHENFWPAACCVAFLTHLASSIMETYSPHKSYQKVAWPWELVSLVFTKNSATLITTNIQILEEGVPQLNGTFCEKILTSVYLFHYVLTILGSEGSKQLILICLWNKVCRKTGFHKAQTIPFETPQSEVHCQIQGRIREEPRGLAALEVVVSSAMGQMFPKGRNTGNCGKLHNWISQKEKWFPYNWGTLQQVPVRETKSYCFLRHIFWKVHFWKGTERCSLQSKYFKCRFLWLQFGHMVLGGKKHHLKLHFLIWQQSNPAN